MAKRALCAVDGCCKISEKREWCGKHYIRWAKFGSPTAGGPERRASGTKCSVDGCGGKLHSGGFCGKHFMRNKAHGNPLTVLPRSRPAIEWIDQHKAYQHEECLTWPFAVNSNGRGKIGGHGPQMSAPRAMCIAAHGEPPTPEHQAAHSCGNGHNGCMNQKHLRWATHAENMADRDFHGKTVRGTRTNTNKLTEDQVHEIRRRIGTQSNISLAREFGVSGTMICDIKKGRAWAWLSPDLESLL